MEYRTVRERAEDFFLEKRSRFIGSIAPAQTEEEALRFLAEIRSEHPQARHHVYAYLLRERNTTRFSDAGEPSGTGGAPVLGVLQKEGLTDVVLVVTRYFGGTLLGAGGLTRAYAHAAKLAVDKASIRVMRLCASVRVSCPYALYDRLAAALSDAALSDPVFTDSVSFSLMAPAGARLFSRKGADFAGRRKIRRICEIKEEFGDLARIS